jgi:hypothetical protein
MAVFRKGGQMKKRFDAELEFRLDRVADEGAATITLAEMYRWFERERITKAVWEEVETRWADRDEGVPLFVGTNDHSFCLIWGKGLTAANDGYFKPISELAGTD